MELLFILAHHLMMIGIAKLVAFTVLAFLLLDFALEAVEKVSLKQTEVYIELLWQGLIYLTI
jgi:hypothetical protein